MASRSQNARQSEARVSQWNRLHSVGIAVIITGHDGEQTPGYTTSPARILPSYGYRRAVIDVDGRQYPLTHISPAPISMHRIAVSIEGVASGVVDAAGTTPSAAASSMLNKCSALWPHNNASCVAVVAHG